ncbi:MAG: ATPase [Planctomycetota bacterium]|nr:MAG: ATPase [Planctomycetota bacterium]
MAKDVKELSVTFERVFSEIKKVIVGQDEMLKKLMVGLLSNGHMLLEGFPGLAKTMAINTFAQTLSAQFKRIQFTPDLLPADVIGTQIYNPQEASFSIKKGPVFTNILLADEINRAPAKVQSALLEAMAEKQVTIAGETHILSDPFMVLATQNPIEQEGTYPLPEAQVDRFLMKINISYPNKVEERQILDRMGRIQINTRVEQVLTLDDITEARNMVDDIYISDELKDYIVDIVFSTRRGTELKEIENLIEVGASPRATIALTLCSKAYALLEGRDHVRSNDIKKIVFDVLRHRISVSYEAEAEGQTSENIIQKILDTLPTP